MTVIAATLAVLLSVATFAFAASSMLSVGLSFALKDILGPLRSVSAVIRALIANFVLVPLLAYVIATVLALDEPLAIGLILTGTAAGAPFLIRLTTTATGNVALSTTMLVLLLPVTVVYLPLVVPLLVPTVSVDPFAIAATLVLSMLLPLGLGLFVKARFPTWAGRLQPIMSKTSSYSLVALVGLTLLTNLSGTLDVTLRAILAAVLLVGGAFAIGYLLGGPNSDSRAVMGLATGQRNVAAATVVATQAVGIPDTTMMVVTASMVGLGVLFPIAAKLREHKAAERSSGPSSPLTSHP